MAPVYIHMDTSPGLIWPQCKGQFSPKNREIKQFLPRIRTSLLIVSRRRLAARFLAAHNIDNFRSIFRLRAFQCDTISCDPLLQSEVTHD